MFSTRWNRIFGQDNRSLIVALDHTASGFMEGWEYPEKTLEKILAGSPNAILANFGILKRFSKHLENRVGRILRLDGGPTDLIEKWPNCSVWKALYTVQDALNLGVDAVIVTLFIGNHLEAISMEIAARVAADCAANNIPCAIHAVPVESSILKNGNDPEIVAFASRLGAELGADFINTYYTGTPEDFKRVTSRCPVPVLTAGGPKTNSDKKILELVKAILDGGGQGVFMGRNVWQNQDPTKILKALGFLIHENCSAEIALENAQTLSK